jgi:SAM-dependent methyltransferase
LEQRESQIYGIAAPTIGPCAFPDGQFEVVLSSMMLHHLPPQARGELAAEIRRVLKPGGRVLVIDFGKPRKKGFLDLLHHRRGHVELKNIKALLTDAGLKVVESGDVGMLGLQFVVAKTSGKDDQVRQVTVSNDDT